MARLIDLNLMRTRSLEVIQRGRERMLKTAVKSKEDYLLLRWMSAMTAVEVHGVWERYVERRLVAALNHDARHFVREQNIAGVKRVSSGLSEYIVNGGGRYFDFRSCGDLIGKANGLVGPTRNPFKALNTEQKSYLDALAVIRNRIVHGSAASVTSYRRMLKSVYNMSAAPGPEEFLWAIDFRASSPARGQARLFGLTIIVEHAIKQI